MELRFPDQMSAAAFLDRYWQKAPLLLSSGLEGYRCPIGPGELAGLALEPEVESRLVLEKGGSQPWEVRHGPFQEDSFARLPASHWTLLVQDVEKHVDELADLLDVFSFLPDWRLDDIMISYATDQGSVGPHVDDYDVFLLQTSGRRRWRIHTHPVSREDYIQGLELRILPRFDTQQEWLLGPGDLLYLPPGVAHWGVAEGDDCMTCSIGFRAPGYRELFAHWSDDMLERQVPDQRYRDPALAPQTHRSEIIPHSLDHIGSLMESLVKQEPAARARWFGCFITEPKPHLQVSPRHEPLTEAAFTTLCRRQPELLRNSWSRFAFIRGDAGQDYLYVNGEEYPLASALGDFLAVLSDNRRLTRDRFDPWLGNADCRQLLCRLYNQSHLCFADEA